MTLLTPDDLERIKEIGRKLQGLRLVGGPVDDAGPLRITMEDITPPTKEEEEKILKEFAETLKELAKERENGK